MKLSIIIISYNEAEYLTKTIDSCLQQDIVDPYEIIIADDGSDDGSLAIIEKYKKQYPDIFKSFVMERNNGDIFIPSVRVTNLQKRAIRIASGEYITLISGDDYYSNNTILSEQIKTLDKDKKLFSCFCDFHMAWEDGRKKTYNSIMSQYKEDMWATNYVHVSCFMFKRSLIEDQLPVICDDTGMVYAITSHGENKRIPIDGFCYRQREHSIMHKTDRFELDLMEMIMYDDLITYDKFKNGTLARYYLPMFRFYLNRNKFSEEKYRKYDRLIKESGYIDRLCINKSLRYTVTVPMRALYAFALRIYFKVVVFIKKDSHL